MLNIQQTAVRPVPLHIIVPVQLPLQERAGTGREGGHIGWGIRRYEK